MKFLARCIVFPFKAVFYIAVFLFCLPVEFGMFCEAVWKYADTGNWECDSVFRKVS